MAAVLLALVLSLESWSGAAVPAGIAFCSALFRLTHRMLFTALAAEERGPALGFNTAASYIGLAFGSALSAFIVGVSGF